MATLNRRIEPKQTNRYRSVYQSYRWQKHSRDFRKKHPLCVICLTHGKTQPSECVDHKIPLMQGGAIWDINNHQAICLSCHSEKTKRENK